VLPGRLLDNPGGGAQKEDPVAAVCEAPAELGKEVGSRGPPRQALAQKPGSQDDAQSVGVDEVGPVENGAIGLVVPCQVRAVGIEVHHLVRRALIDEFDNTLVDALCIENVDVDSQKIDNTAHEKHHSFKCRKRNLVSRTGPDRIQTSLSQKNLEYSLFSLQPRRLDAGQRPSADPEPSRGARVPPACRRHSIKKL